MSTKNKTIMRDQRDEDGIIELIKQDMIDDPLKIALELAYYRNLKKDGNIYSNIPEKDHTSLLDLLVRASARSKTEGEVKKLIYCGFQLSGTEQKRSIKSYNIHRMLLNLASLLARTYKKENDTSCPRVKASKDTEELLSCRSGHMNTYPISYIKKVRKYLEKYPLDKWCDINPSKVEEDYIPVTVEFEDGTRGTKYECKACKKLYTKGSRYSHLSRCRVLHPKKKPENEV